MRTTLTLDDDIAARIAELQKQQKLSFKDAINQTLRRGLEVHQALSNAIPPFTVKARAMGVRSGLNYANISELLEQVEGETHR
jgi:hypothetical protein